MKKKNFTMALLTFSSIAFAQVGINTPTPTATLDITAKNATGTSTAVDGLLVTRVDRLRAQSMTGIPTSTMIYIDGIANGSQAGNAVNIDAVGYYYYNGSVWVKLHNPGNTTDISIYNTNGTLTGNRIVTQGSNTLAFTANAVNAFSVNGNNFSVDALNRRVGIGTAAPSSFLSILNPVAGTITDVLSLGIDNCGAPCAQGTPRNITLYNNNVTNPLFGGIEFIPSINPTGISGASIIGIDRDVANNYAGLQVFTRNATDYAARMTIKSSGNVGIGTVLPATKLDVQSGGTPATPAAAIKIVDGNQANGYVLTSDATGVGTWKALPATGSVNIYNTDGVLTGNRIVAQGANTLAFTATSANAFSVAGNLFSVDAATKRIGLGTITPKQQLHIVETGSTSGITTSFISGMAVTGVGAAAGISGPGLYLENVAAPVGSRLLKINYSLNSTEPILNFQTVSDDASTAVSQILTLTRSGKLGINAAPNPGSNLSVNGNATIGNSYITNAAPANGAIIQGLVGVGTNAPTNQLHVNAAADPLRLQGTTVGNTTTDPLMVLDANGVVKTIGTLGALSIPNPALFRLDVAQTDFLNGVAAGSSSTVPMAVIKNSIAGMTYNAGTSTITFPAGTYQITFVYEAIHNNDNGTTVEADKCRNSSYIVDFPTGAASTQRIHSTAYHNSGTLSNHGGTITYSTTVPAGRTWPIRLGRGQSGNCTGTGMTLAAASTQLLVFRIGD